MEEISNHLLFLIQELQKPTNLTPNEVTNALTEFTGLDPDKIEIEILLSAYLGVSVQEEISKIFKYEREGRTLSFILGDKRYGKYRWTITSHKIKAKTFDGKGNITQATVSISLQEYLKE